MPQKIIVYWRDIPSQVLIKKGRAKGKWMMSQRFQEAIDRAAMRAGLAESDAYVEEWHRVTTECECTGDLDACAQEQVNVLDAMFPEERLTQVVKNKGLLPAE